MHAHLRQLYPSVLTPSREALFAENTRFGRLGDEPEPGCLLRRREHSSGDLASGDNQMHSIYNFPPNFQNLPDN